MSVTASQGFVSAGLATGLKSSGERDLALVANQGPHHVATAVFTSNRVCAAPVQYSREILADQQAQAVILNSGGANACTGAPGYADAQEMASQVAAELHISPDEVVVASTGLIGERLPMSVISAGITQATSSLADSKKAGIDAAQAIMTTDSVPKMAQGSWEVPTTDATAENNPTPANSFTIGGMAKGAGMLAPALATMLVVITTDAVIDSASAGKYLRAATALTFDRIDSDGCQSTNDMVLLMASGASGVKPDGGQFTSALTEVCQELARGLIADAEGASHEVEIAVVEAESEDDALEVARSVGRSNLVKTALYGNDPNWGRILASVGTTSAAFDPHNLDVWVNGVHVCQASGIGEPRELVDMTPRECHIRINLHAGTHAAAIWTNDLTKEYVHENSAYST